MLDALDGEDRADPRVIGEVIADLIFASGREHEQRRPVIRVAKRSAEDNYALIGEAVDEGCVRVSAELLAPWP